jgi:polyphenol oxidase
MQQLRPQSGPLLLAAGFKHGFFGRAGGLSKGAYTSLNCSYAVGDEASDVTQNLARVARYLDVQSESLVAVSQVHGNTVLDVDEAFSLREVDRREADALLGMHSNCALCIRTADCVPLLVGCRASGAAAAVHAGWRGVVAGVVPAAIDRLFEKGARPESLVAAIGPHIGLAAFEVSGEVAMQLDGVAPLARMVDWKSGNRPHVRLAGLVLAQLLSKGVKPNQVDVLEECTFSNERDFFSFRRDGRVSGRQISAICPLER